MTRLRDQHQLELAPGRFKSAFRMDRQDVERVISTVTQAASLWDETVAMVASHPGTLPGEIVQAAEQGCYLTFSAAQQAHDAARALLAEEETRPCR